MSEFQGPKAITVAEMTEREQIERLIRQRNELWKLIDRFAMAHGDDGDGEGDGLRLEDRNDLGFGNAEIEEDGDEIVVRLPNPLTRLAKVRRAAGALWNECRTIVGNTYLVEGRNPYTEDTLTDEELEHKSFEPYLKAPGGW